MCLCVCLSVCLFVCPRRDNSKNIEPIITKLGQYMHPGTGHKLIVFGVSRSKVKVTKVKFDFIQWFQKNRHNFLITGRRDSNKKQNVQEDELYNPGMIIQKYR